ncbi:hypothetical protein LINPERHAP1_LOCUS8324 [Linum perenne]
MRISIRAVVVVLHSPHLSELLSISTSPLNIFAIIFKLSVARKPGVMPTIRTQAIVDSIVTSSGELTSSQDLRIRCDCITIQGLWSKIRFLSSCSTKQ